MLLHGSLSTAPGEALRRVLYYSHQSAGWMEREGVITGFPVSRTWNAQNIKLLAHALEAHRSAAHLVGEEQFHYEVSAEWKGDVAGVDLDLRPAMGNLPWER